MEVEIANPAAKDRWIMKNGEWHSLPSGLASALRTPLFSWHDKFRILAEPFRRKGSNPDETVADLVKRRLGNSYLEYAVDPFISGIYAGDPKRLVTRYALPKLYTLEQKYGSFIKGGIKKSKEHKSEIEKKVSRDVFSVKGGLKNLIMALGNAMDPSNIQLEASEITVRPFNGRFQVSFRNNKVQNEILSDKVISTIAGVNIPSVFQFLGNERLIHISNVSYAKVVQVVACYKKWEGKSLNAFGGLIPGRENRDCLGILFPASLFPERAPAGGAILSAFLGGIKKPGIIEKSDAEITALFQKEVADSLNAHNKPDFTHIFRYEHAIPQYEKNTGDRLAAIEAVQNEFPGLILAGNIRDGIGMADRVKQAKQIAMQLLDKKQAQV